METASCYLEDGLHRALRAALQQRTTLTSGSSTWTQRRAADVGAEPPSYGCAGRRQDASADEQVADDGVGEQPAALGEHQSAALGQRPGSASPHVRAFGTAALPPARAIASRQPSPQPQLPSITRSVSCARRSSDLAAGRRAAAGVQAAA